MNDNEIWKEVHDNDRYLISNKDRCKSKINNILLKPNYNNGYIRYRLYYKNKKRTSTLACS